MRAAKLLRAVRKEYGVPLGGGWTLVKWLWLVEVVTRPRGRFVLQKKRWIVERTFGWLNQSRRLAESCERTTQSHTAFVQIAMIHLMVKRLA